MMIIEQIKKLAQMAAQRSADALSKLTGFETEIEVITVREETLHYQLPSLSNDSFVVGISLPLRGDITGSVLMLFPKDIALQLACLLTKQDNSSMHGFDEMEVSALKEVGNILCGNFFTVIANQLNISVIEHIPVFMFDTVSSVLMQAQSINAMPNKAMMIELRFEFKPMTITGYIILILGLHDIDVFENAFKKVNWALDSKE